MADSSPQGTAPFVCKCGAAMVFYTEDVGWLPAVEHQKYYYICPKERWWNFWKHTAPIYAGKNY